MKTPYDTTAKLITLPDWMWKWLKENTPDDSSKEIRRAIKQYIETKNLFKSIPNNK